MPEGIGDVYQRQTRYERGRLPRAEQIAPPDTYRRYPDALGTVELPSPETTGGRALWEIIAARRSERAFRPAALSLAEIGQLLWATQGVTERVRGFELRAAPSAGALYPCETYVIANRVEGLEPGLYHYLVREHALEFLRAGNMAEAIADACLGQAMASAAGAVFAWTGVVDRSKAKYGQRGYRYMYLDAGHIGGQLHLAAVSLGLGCCAIGAFLDDAVEDLVRVDGVTEATLYLSCVGRL